MKRALVGLGLFFCLLTAAACVRLEPDADGRALGELHVQMLRADELTVDALVDDLKKAEQRHETPEARREFERAYREAVAPERAKIAALVVKDAGRRAQETVRDVGRQLGETFRDLTRDIGESVEELRSDDEGFKETLRQFGREVGKTIRGVSEGVEAIADGVEEELESDAQRGR